MVKKINNNSESSRVNKVVKLQNLAIDLSQRNEDLEKGKDSDRRVIYILSVLTLVFAVLAGLLVFKISVQETKYAYASPDGRIIPFTMYDTPYLQVKDRIRFIERVAIQMNSVSWYNREEIYSEMYPLFYKSTFNEILEALEEHEIFNRANMKRQKISSSASIIKGAKLINDNVKNIKGFPPHVVGEEYEMDMIQEIRKKSLGVLNLKFRLRMVIVRVDPNRAPQGFKITKYKINALN